MEQDHQDEVMSIKSQYRNEVSALKETNTTHESQQTELQKEVGKHFGNHFSAHLLERVKWTNEIQGCAIVLLTYCNVYPLSLVEIIHSLIATEYNTNIDNRIRISSNCIKLIF